MIDLSRLRGLVLDAGVLTNLLATQKCSAVLHALSTHCVSPLQAVAEIVRDPVSRRLFLDQQSLIQSLAPLDVQALAGRAYDNFLNIVGAPSLNGLSDGEAACIAVAGELGYAACFDDGKVRRICKEKYPEINVFWSVDLIGHTQVMAALGADEANKCRDNAVKIGGMRLPII